MFKLALICIGCDDFLRSTRHNMHHLNYESGLRMGLRLGLELGLGLGLFALNLFMWALYNQVFLWFTKNIYTYLWVNIFWCFCIFACFLFQDNKPNV